MPASSKKPTRVRDGVPLRAPLTDAQRAALANHPEPSAKSLAALPPLDMDKAVTFGRGPDALQAGFEYQRAKRGRPKKGEAAPGSKPRSVRFLDSEWAALKQCAKRRHTTVHALLRKAVARELAEETMAPIAAPAQPAKARKRKAG